MSLVKRIKILCDKKKITFAELERNTGISNGQIRRWDTSSPKTENVQKVADYFNVSVDYLLGRTEDKQILEVEIDENTRSLARDFQELDDDSQDLLKKLIKSMSKKGKEAKRE